MSLPHAIGISGFASAGKTTVANILETQFGYQRRHIAEPLRDMLRVLLRHHKMSDTSIDRYLTGDLKEAVIPCLGVTSRHAQITLGTEWGRKRIDDDLWVRTWDAGITGIDRVMNDSVRFPNEAAAIRARHGITLMVKRPGTHPVAFRWGIVGRWLYCWFGIMWGVHDSERTDRISADFVILNDGREADLEAKVWDIMMKLRWS